MNKMNKNFGSQSKTKTQSTSRIIYLLLPAIDNSLMNKWTYLAILSLIWGSSFILMKKALIGLTPIQLGAFRIVFTAIVLLFSGWRDLRGLSRRDWKWLAITGAIGTLIPVFLFAFAQTQIHSSTAALLNSLTPIQTFIISVLFYGVLVRRWQALGLVLGLVGSIVLLWQGLAEWNTGASFSLLIILATLCYGFNANFIKQKLSHLPALTLTKANFVSIILPALVVLGFSNFDFQHVDSSQYRALGFVAILAVFGTAFAKILFNELIKKTSAVFASSVTYTMPVVALFWGFMDGEDIYYTQILGGVLIIVGIYLIGKKSLR